MPGFVASLADKVYLGASYLGHQISALKEFAVRPFACAERPQHSAIISTTLEALKERGHPLRGPQTLTLSALSL